MLISTGGVRFLQGLHGILRKGSCWVWGYIVLCFRTLRLEAGGPELQLLGLRPGAALYVSNSKSLFCKSKLEGF